MTAVADPVTVWHLELTARSAYVPSAQTARYRLERVTADAPAFLRWLYLTAGAAWRWVERLAWTDDDWRRRWADPAVEVWVAYELGVPAGYFELARHPDGVTVEIAYFGLLPHAIGRGQGGALLNDAVERAWSLGAGRVYLNTCAWDHPRALENYRRRGFRVFREEQRVIPVPPLR